MKKLFNYLRLLIISIFLIGLLYGGLNLANLNLQKVKAGQSQEDIAKKILSLENKLNNLENHNSELENKIINLESDLNNITPVSSKPIEITKYIEKEPIIKTVTQTKVVKEIVREEIEKNQAVVTIENIGSFRVDLQENENAFTILKEASTQNGFPLEYQEYSFGVFITSIGGIKPSGNQYWAFYYNGKYSMVGASDQKINKNDTTFWRLESF